MSRSNPRHHRSPGHSEPPLPIPSYAPPPYNPPRAQYYTSAETAQKFNRLNHVTFLSARIDHPQDAVLEYPETTADTSKLAHIFKIDPNAFRNPTHNIQYSFQVTGGSENLKCQLLQVQDNDGFPVPAVCYKMRGDCCGVKLCNFSSNTHSFPSHTFVDLESTQSQPSPPLPFSAKREVFEKTLALFCSVKVDGCHADAEGTPSNTITNDITPGEESELVNIDLLESTLVERLARGFDHGESSGITGRHLTPDYDDELDAEGEVQLVSVLGRRLESHTFAVPDLMKDRDISYSLIFMSSTYNIFKLFWREIPQSSMTLSLKLHDLEHWHRDDAGFLRPGRLTLKVDCNSLIETFIPYDLHTYPYVVLVTSRPHTHPPPRRSKTPPVHTDIVRTLLIEQDWRLADATPRRLSLNKAFISRLKSLLNWELLSEPVLSDLHPSLGNQQKVNYIIKRTKELRFTAGTDWAGARLLHSDHAQRLSPEDQYLRFADELKISSGESFRFAICMFPAQSRLLSRARWITCDTSYKRVKLYKEFGLEGWDERTHRSISYCRVFMTSESAEAHRLLFHQISRIVTQDTGTPLQFAYIHGQGIEVITADEGKGQALGLGLFLQDICRDNMTFDTPEPTRRLSELLPYDHLARILRLCIVHFQRNIHKIEGKLQPDTIAAMYSLASSQPLRDIDGTLDLIRRGGRVAQNWLYDKEVSAPFALPALYQPLSRIPLERWLAARSTTNGIEQTHHNYNIDGINLTLLGGIMHGYQYDARAISGQDLSLSTLILPTYNPSNHLSRAQTALRRQARTSQKRSASQQQNPEDPTLRSPARKRVAK
ncbi:hypothetical protein FRB90_002658, partial [Tulasnella sp. 427]